MMRRLRRPAGLLVAATASLAASGASAQHVGALEWCGNHLAAARDDRVITLDAAGQGVWRGTTFSPEDAADREVAFSRDCGRVAVADLRTITLFGPPPSATRLGLALPKTTPFVVLGDRFELDQRALAFAPDGSRVVVELSNDAFGRPMGTTELVAFETGSGAATSFAHAGPRDRVPFAFAWLDTRELAVIAAVPGSDWHALRVSATTAIELATTGLAGAALSRDPVIVFTAVGPGGSPQRFFRIDPRTGVSNEVLGAPVGSRLVGATRDGTAILTARFGAIDPTTHTVPAAWLEARPVTGGASRPVGIDGQREVAHSYQCDGRATTCVAYSRTASGALVVVDAAAPTRPGRTVFATASGESIWAWRVSDDGKWLAVVVDVDTPRPPRRCPLGFRGSRSRSDLVVVALANTAAIRREALSDHDACIDPRPRSVD